MNKFLTLTLVSDTKLAGLEKVISVSKVFSAEQLKEFYANIDEYFKERKFFTLAIEECAAESVSELSDMRTYVYKFIYNKSKLLEAIKVVDISDEEVSVLNKFGVSYTSSDDTLSDLETLFEI